MTSGATAVVPFLSPSFPAPDVVGAAFAEVAASGTFSNGGPAARAFGAALGERVGVGPRGVALVANATLGLQLAIEATFVHDRPEVLVASFTFAAAPLAAVWAGYRPVLIDIDAATWQPSIAAAADHLHHHGGSVAGIVLTHTFGVADPAIDEWEALAARHGVSLVIDAAAGFGSTDAAGVPLGGRGTCTVFSFHATKSLAIGEGGAVVSRDTALVDTIDRLKNFGFDAERRSLGRGTNAKLDELSCRIGLLQLAELDGRLAHRRRVLAAYRAVLEPAGCRFQRGAEHSAVAFVSTLLPEGVDRLRLRAALAEAGIETRAYYDPPVHEHPAFAGSVATTLCVTNDFATRMLSLPTSDHLDLAVVGRVAVALSEELTR